MWQILATELEGSHVVPLDDVVEHTATRRCICAPPWKAQWSQEIQSVIWVFIHHAADGRPRPS